MATISHSVNQSMRSETHETRQNKGRASKSGSGGAPPQQHVTFLIDASGSMFATLPGSSQTRIAAVSEAAKSVVQKMHPKHKLTITLFDSNTQTIATGVSKGAYDAAAVVNAAHRLGGGTQMWTALWSSTADVRSEQDALHQIVVFTDGEATDSNCPVKEKVFDWLKTKPRNVKIYFITSEMKPADETMLRKLPESVVKLIKIDAAFDANQLQTAFSNVSKRVEHSYDHYSSHSKKTSQVRRVLPLLHTAQPIPAAQLLRAAATARRRKLTSSLFAQDASHTETQSVKIDQAVLNAITNIAKVNPEAAGLAIKAITDLTTQSLTDVQAPASRSGPGALLDRPKSDRRAIKGRDAGRLALPANCEKEWGVTSNVAGFVISRMKKQNVAAQYGVSITVAPKPQNMSYVVEQAWKISGDPQSVNQACEALTNIRSSLKGPVK